MIPPEYGVFLPLSIALIMTLVIVIHGRMVERRLKKNLHSSHSKR
ncbi:MAG: hypothetical protein ACD_28C00242G0004 [uncultured bacterium]|nr:MAG: hypothetical protein ACD_28C00242G0004 [uncultured bacterium]